MIGIPLGLIAVNYVEWYTHKYLLHGKGKHRGSRFSIHWDHHRETRRHDFADPVHYGPTFKHSWDSPAARKEILMLAQAAAFTVPLFPVAPFFTMTLWYGTWHYWSVHRRAHAYPEWGRTHLPWHYDHHMNSDQNANWCVTKPWFDYVLGTRVAPRAETRESNPLGVRLPDALEQPVNRLARRFFPETYRKIDGLSERERKNREQGTEGFVPAFARE